MAQALPDVPAEAAGLPVRLRPAVLDDVPRLDRWRSPEFAGEFNDLGVRRVSSYRDAVLEGSLVDESGGLLVVERLSDGEAVGSVTWHAVAYGPNVESRAWNIGIALVPDARGQGLGGPAQRLLADHLLATTSAERVEASTDVANAAEQRALEKAGFAREGIARAAQHRAGAWHDLVVYSRVRVDP